MAKHGVDVDVYYCQRRCYPDPRSVHATLFDDLDNVRLFPVYPRELPYFPGHYYSTCWWESRFFVKTYIDSGNKADFIYAHGYCGWRACQLRKRSVKHLPPVGVHSHGVNALQEKFSMARLLANSFAPFWQRNIVRIADVQLSLGGAVESVLRQFAGPDTQIVAAMNGIGCDWIASETISQYPLKGPVRFLFIGRDTAVKGYQELRQAVVQLIGEKFPFELHMVGEFHRSNVVDHPCVILHGRVVDEPRLKSIYRNCHVLLLPSHSEGMPTVILEALASGLPVLATDVGAIRSVVDSSVGRLLKVGDVGELLMAMRECKSWDFSRMRRAAVQRASLFTWDKVVERTIAEIRTAINQGDV